MSETNNNINIPMEKRLHINILRGFVFDFDGTLVDSKIDFPRMKKEIVLLLKKGGVYIDGAERKLYALELIELGCKALSKKPDLQERFKKEAFSIIEQLELERCHFATAFPRVEATLKRLSELGYKIGIISRNGKAAIQAVLSRISLHHDVVLCRDDVENIKPDPGHLLKAIEALGVEPREVAMVGDHPIDIKCGRAARVFTIGVLTSVSSRKDLQMAGADLVIPDVSHIMDLLDGKNLTPST